jgi:hypothetical protein
MKPLWTNNFDLLRDSLLAQAKRIRSNYSHPTITGTSLEVVLRRTLRDYLPDYFAIGSGQLVNNKGEKSPQLDIIVYDHNVFPHLAVNEDSSVIVCCEAMVAAIECKARWDGATIGEHYSKFAEAESVRYKNYSDSSNAAAYFAVVFDDLNLISSSLSAFKDDGRVVGMYSVEGTKSWHSGLGEKEFAVREGNGLAALVQDILFDCMRKGQKEVGDFSLAYEALHTYFTE